MKPTDPYQIFTQTYIERDGHAIDVDVLVPKTLLKPTNSSRHTKRPLLVRIHGGWLVGGQRDCNVWCPQWVLSLALEHEAIVVSPDYRFLPEVTAEDILDDIDAFWAWVKSDLQTFTRDSTAIAAEGFAGLEVDLENVLIEGESAGGYLATQLALGHSQDTHPRIRALISIYPMLGLRSPYWSTAYEKQIFDHPQYPASLIDDHLSAYRNADPKPVLSNVDMDSSGRGKLAAALVQHGRFLEALGSDRDPSKGKRRVHPEDRVEDGLRLPPTVLIHGTSDEAVPIEGTEKFIDLLKKYRATPVQNGETLARYVPVEGGGHGFDVELDPRTEWVQDVVRFLKEFWPAPANAIVMN